MEWGNYEEEEATASLGCHRRLVHVRRIANGTTRFADVARSGLDLTEHSPRTNAEALHSRQVHSRICARVFRLRPTRLNPGGSPTSAMCRGRRRNVNPIRRKRSSRKGWIVPRQLNRWRYAIIFPLEIRWRDADVGRNEIDSATWKLRWCTRSSDSQSIREIHIIEERIVWNLIIFFMQRHRTQIWNIWLSRCPVTHFSS